MVQLYTDFIPLLKRIKQIFSTEDLEETLVIRESIMQIQEDIIVLTDAPTALVLLSQRPTLKVMALSDVPSFDEGQVLLQKGLKAYANTYIHQIHLNQAISLVNSGNIWLYPSFMKDLIKQSSLQSTSHAELLDKLSQREKETALEVVKGSSNKEIASSLNITERTVKAHLSSIFEKLGIGDRFTLALMLK